MKQILLTTIAAVVLVGCGESMPIHNAARDGNIEAVRQHLAAGADVNAKNQYGSTSLHFAAGYGRNEMAELLIAAGAEVNAKTKRGETPLDLAEDDPKIRNPILKHGGKTGEGLKAE